MSQEQIKEILTEYKVIAIVGLSPTVDKPSHAVGSYLQQQGFKIIPINPFAEEVLGEKSYKSLLDIPPKILRTIEVVNIFRSSKDVMPIVEQAIKIKKLNGKPYVIWMQLDIVNEQAAKVARDAGMTVIMDKCMMVEHQQLAI